MFQRVPLAPHGPTSYLLLCVTVTIVYQQESIQAQRHSVPMLTTTVLSTQGDVYFTSSSNMVHATFCKTPTSARSFSHLPTKLPKNFDKKDFTSSGRFSEAEESTYIYKISLESMTGRRDFESSTTVLESNASLRNSSSDESVCKAEGVSTVSDEGNSDESAHRLDFIHPILGGEEKPLVEASFQDDSSPVNSLRRKGRAAHLTPSPRDSEEDSPVNSLRRRRQPHLNPSPRDSEDDSPVNSLRRKQAVHFSPTPAHHRDANGHPTTLPTSIEQFSRVPTRHGSDPSHSPTKSAAFPEAQPHRPRVSAAHSCSKLRRTKVLTSRKSLDAGSRWLYPYFSTADDNPMFGSHHMTGRGGSVRSGRGAHDAPEILGTLENVVYSSPDSGVHDLSLSSNHSDINSYLAGRGEPQNH